MLPVKTILGTSLARNQMQGDANFLCCFEYVLQILGDYVPF